MATSICGPRDHYKSTIVSVALSIFEIIRDPEVTIPIKTSSRDPRRRRPRQTDDPQRGHTLDITT